MVIQGDPTEPKRDKEYRVVGIDAFDPVAFDAAVEEVGQSEELDLPNGHWRDINAKFIVVGDDLIIFSAEGFHMIEYENAIAGAAVTGPLHDAGRLSVNQKRQADGNYLTHTRRFFDMSPTLKQKGLLDPQSGFAYRNDVLAHKLADHFYWN